MITLKNLKEMKPGVFLKGEIEDSPNGINVANTGKQMRWVAVRGDIHDWAIYVQNPHYINSTDPEVLEMGYGGVWSWEKIADVGDKVHNHSHIRRMVECDDEAFKMYRH